MFKALKGKTWVFVSVCHSKILSIGAYRHDGIRIAVFALTVIVTTGTLFIVFAQQKSEPGKRTETLHVFPSSVTAEGWQNIQTLGLQDLDNDAIYQSFTTENSAYLSHDEPDTEPAPAPTGTPQPAPTPEDVDSSATATSPGTTTDAVDSTSTSTQNGSEPDTSDPPPTDDSTDVPEEPADPAVDDVPLSDEPEPAEHGTSADASAAQAGFSRYANGMLTFFKTVAGSLPFAQMSTTTPVDATDPSDFNSNGADATEVPSDETDPDSDEVNPEGSTEGASSETESGGSDQHEPAEMSSTSTAAGPGENVADAATTTESATEDTSSPAHGTSTDSGLSPDAATTSTNTITTTETTPSFESGSDGVPAAAETVHTLTLDDFSLPPLASGQFITNVQLRLSFAARQDAFDASTTPPRTLDVSYQLGSTTQKAGSIVIEDETSNALNGGYYLFALPVVENVAELKNLTVTLTYEGEADVFDGLYLDSAWVEMDTEIFDRKLLKDRVAPQALGHLQAPKVASLLSEDLDFTRHETPIFSLRYNSQRNAVVRTVRSIFSNQLATVESATFIHRDLGPIGVSPIVDVTDDGLVTVQVPESERSKLRPGQYTVELTFAEGEYAFTDTFDFQWGMLSINPTQSEYTIADTATIHMGALTPNGNTLCNANLNLYVIDPNEYMERVPVERSGECDGNNVTDVPDYAATYEGVTVAGTYELYLERVDDNGNVIAHTSDTFEVVNMQDVYIERTGPSRIYPPAPYPMDLTVHANDAFEGTLVERVPNSFTITETDAAVRDTGEYYELTWEFATMASTSRTFSYTFDAPDLSPYLYELGPARLTPEATDAAVDVRGTSSATGSVPTTASAFEEHRQWQIASDATGNMILFWDDGGSIPTDWTCLSCGSGTFYQRFVMGSSTYNSTGGSATHGHSASGTVFSSTDAFGESGGGSVAPVGHTHTYSPTVSTESNLPAYRQLRVIQYTASAGEPATIPAGAIGIFDVASSSLPSGWTRYAAQDGSFIRGEDTPGTTGGSNTHSHTISGSTGASSGAGTRNRGGSGAGPAASDAHTHTVDGSTGSDSNEPPYVEVLLAKLGSDASAPNGLIAMWTEDVPSGWLDISSDPGAAFSERFIKPATTYGTTNGSATHGHADVTGITSSGPSATVDPVRSGTAGSDDAHTHDVDVTNISNESNLPPYLTAVFGKRQGTNPVYEQASSRWYVNEDAEPPTDPWPSGASDLLEREPISATSTPVKGNEVVRLRMNVGVTNATSSAGSAFNLQYATGTECSAASGWQNVGDTSSSSAWRGHDNGSVTDHVTLSSTTLASTTVGETYEENGFATNTPNEIGPGEYGEWDFVIENNGAAPGEAYCFRLVESDGTAFLSYSHYPKLVTNEAPEAPTLHVLFDNEKTASTSPHFEFTATDAEGEDVHYEIEVDDDHAFTSTVIDRDTITNSSLFENLVVSSDKEPYTEGERVRFIPSTTLSDGTTYYWRVRAQDPDGSGGWGEWSTVRSFTIDTSLSASAWFQTEDEQFDTNTLDGVETGGDEVDLSAGSSTGSMISSAIDFSDGTLGTAWDSLRFNDTETAGDLTYQIEYRSGTSTWALIPDGDLAGNSTGFDTSPVSLLGLDVETYGTIRVTATFTDAGGSPSLQDWQLDWGYRVETPRIEKLFPNERTGTTTPAFEFSTSDPQNDDLTYQVSISTDHTFVTGTTTRTSDTDAGFSNAENGADPDPFNSGDTVRFTLQPADALTNNTTYWWRVRAKDTTGDDAYSFWTEPRSFTVATDTVVSTWFQTTEEQFDTDILSGTQALVSDEVTVATTATEAMIVYGEGTENTPRYREWDGASWGSEGAMQDIGATLRWAVVRAGTTREEYVAATAGTDNDINAQVFATGEWDNLQEMTATMGDTTARGFDVAYETVSGDALVVYCDGDDDPSYRIWDGSGWSSEGTITTTSADECRWLELASDPTTDEIVMVVRDADGSEYEGIVWDGASWGNAETFGASRDATYSGISVMYEESGDEAVAAVPASGGGPDRMTYATWDGTNWTVSTNEPIDGRLYWSDITRNVGTDDMVLCYINDNADVQAIRWTGSGWTGDTELTGTVNAVTDPAYSCVYETTSGNEDDILAVYSDTSATDYRTYNGTWSGASPVNSIGDAATMRLIRTGDGTILGSFLDDPNDDLLFSSWDGSGWSTTETLESDVSVDSSPFGHPYSLAPRNPGSEGTTIVSPGIQFSDGLGPYWDQMSWVDTTPGASDILYRVQYQNASGTWAFIPDSDLPGNSSGTSTSPINLSDLDVSTYGTIRPHASLSCDGANNCPTLQDWTVTWAEGITVSGTYQDYDQTTNKDSGTLAVAVNGTLQTGKTGTVSGGTWSIGNVTAFSGDIVTVFVNGTSSDAEAVGVARYDGTDNMTGIELYERHLSLGSDDATSTPITNADIGLYDFTNTEDVFADVAGGALDVCADGGCTDAELYIKNGTTYQPKGSVDTHDIENNGTFEPNGNTIRVNGSWDNNATATMATSTVIMTATSTGESIDETGAASPAFYNLTFGEGSGTATWTPVTALDVNNDLSVQYGTLSRAGVPITIAGSLNTGGNGFWSGIGTTTFDGSGTDNWSDENATLQNVGDVVVDGTSKNITLTGDVAAESMTIGADDIFDVSSSHYDVTIYDNWTNTNTFAARQGTVTFAATDPNRTITAGGDAFYDLTFNGVGGSWSFTESTLSLNNDLTIATGTVTLPSGTTTLAGSFDSTGGVFAHNNSAIRFTAGSSETIAASGTPFANNFFTMHFDGSGSWSLLDANATSSNDLIIRQGTVTFPTGVLSIGGSLSNTAGSFVHNSGEVKMTGAASESIDVTAPFNNLTFSGSGSWTFADADVTALGDVTVFNGTATFPSGTFSIGGSLSNSASIVHSSGTVLFNSADAGETVDLGSSALYDMTFNGATGGWTVNAHATATNDVTLENVSDFTLASGQSLSVGNVFTNSIGGASTTWIGSTLSLENGAYAINAKDDTGDTYDTLRINASADVSMWHSQASSTNVLSGGSLYSQDHAGVDGDLYIYGSYERASGTEHWSYETDFDGADLGTTSARQANVRFENGASASLTDAVLSIQGTTSASTSIAAQSGTYTISISGGTTSAAHYDFADLGSSGLSLVGGTIVLSLSDGAFTPAAADGTGITLSSTTIDANPEKQLFRIAFATSSPISATNVSQTDGNPSSYWWFRNGSGNIEGESFDSDTGDPGSVRWDDSALTVTVSGTVYESDESTPVTGGTCDGATTPVRIVVENGGTYDGSCSNVDGSYSIPGVVIVGDPTVTVFLNDASGGERAAAVTKTVTADVTDLDLYEGRVIVRHEDTEAMTIADLADYDNSDDADIQFTAATGTEDVLSVFSGNELHVWASSTFAPGGPVTLNANASGDTWDGTLHIDGDATFEASGTTTYTVGGSIDVEAGGSFAPASTTINMTASTTGKTIDTAAAEILSIHNLAFTGAGGGWNVNGNISASGDVEVATGTVTGTGDVTLTHGSFFGDGLVSMGGGTTTIERSSTLGGTRGWSFHDLTLGSGSIVGTTTPASNATTTISGRLTIETAHFLDLGSSVIDLSGSGTVFVENGTFLEDTSTVRYSGTGPTDILSTDYHDLILDAAAGSPTYTATGLGVQVLGDLSVGPTGTTTVSFDVADPALNIDGDMTIGPLGIFTASDSATFTLGGSYANAGTFTGSGGVLTFDGNGTHSIAAGESSFSSVDIDGSGDFTVTEHATASDAWSLTGANTLTVSAGATLAVGGTFTNDIGGAATTWTGATLSLYGGNNYEINGKAVNDVYDTLSITGDTQIRMWNSTASSTNVSLGSSLYSMDHSDVAGDLYVYGDYKKSAGTDHWSYARDFDGTDLSGGNERKADVYFENGASAAYTGGGLSVIGDGSASTTVQNQGSGSYGLRIGGNASTTFSYYEIRDINGSGLTFSGSPNVADLSNGDILVAVEGGTGMTVGGTVIDANPAKTFSQNIFATTTAISAANVTATGTSVSSWRFTNHAGTIAGEAFDSDPDGDPGYIVWDDSAANITISGTVYSDEGSTVSGICDGSTENVHVRVAGLTSYTGSCDGGNGTYSISGITYSPGDTITIYIDEEAVDGAAVTADPVSNISNMDIYEHRVIVRHENTDPLSIDDMAVWDSNDDTDIPFTAVSGSPDTLTLPSNTKLIVWTGKTFSPGGDVTLSGGGSGTSYDGALELYENATFEGGGTESYSIGGSVTAGSGATFTAANTSVTMTSSSSTLPIDVNESAFYDLTFSGSGGWSVDDATLTVNSDLTITQGSVALPSGTTTVGGSFTNTGGNFAHNGGTLSMTEAGAGNLRVGGSDLATLSIDGPGSVTFLDTHATATEDVLVNTGTLAAASGTLAVGGDFIVSDAFTHEAGTLRMTAATATDITASTSDLGSVTIAGAGAFTMTDESVTLLGSLSIETGSLAFPSTTLSIGGSLTNSGGSFNAGSSTVLMNSSDTGETITAGGADFYRLTISAPSGGYTITESATTTSNFSLTSANDFTLQSGATLAVGGVFTNTVGGASTTWSGSALVIDSGTGYSVNTKSSNGDRYDALSVGANTDLRMWHSAASMTTVDPSGSLYSQDHDGVDGSLYVYGDYRRTAGADHWSYGTDFDGADLSGGSERAVTVAHAAGASTTITGGTLEIRGASGNETTVTNQGSGTYGMQIEGGTLYGEHYAFRDLGAAGLELSGTTTVTSLNTGDFELAVDGGSLITLSSTTLNHNASLVVTGVRFASTSAITGTNVELVGTTPSAWTFTGETGNLAGEAFDVDGGSDCGSIRWSDSTCLLTEQSAYRWRANDGGEGIPDSEWFDQDWEKRTRVTAENTDASGYTDAVVRLDVTYDSDMQADFDDLRFTDSSGTTTLEHFIESYTASTDAIVWVKVPELATSSSETIYMYYGNGTAGDSSSGTSTFIAFDDFEDGDISEYSGDTGEFTVTSGGEVYERTYSLKAADPDAGRTQSGGMYNNAAAMTVSQGETLRYHQYVDTSSGGSDESCTLFATQSQTENYAVCLELFGTDRISISRDVLDNDTSGTVLASTTVAYSTGWYEVEVDWGTDDSIAVTLSQNDSVVATTTATDGTYTSGGIGYSFWFYHGAWDTYTSRPLLTTEPTVTFGGEQVPGGASWLAGRNTKASSIETGVVVRPRFLVENTGLSVTDQYRLEYAAKGSSPSCEAVSNGDYSPVPAQGSCSGSPICMQNSSEFTNRASTTDVLGGDGTFTAGQIVEDPDNDTQSITVGSSEYTELEYAVEATNDAIDSNYCLRVTDAGSALDSYTRVAELELLFTPVVTALSLNSGLDIALAPGGTTTVHATGTVSDLNGHQDLDDATSTIFRSGVGTSCTEDLNNCYIAGPSQCTYSNCAGNSCDIDCTADLYYFADPTDAGTFGPETWRAHLEVRDQGGSVGTGTAPSIDLLTLRAIATDDEIDYGALAPTADTGATTSSSTLQNIGNDTIDISLEGTDLTDGNASVIPVNNQKYATSTFTYSTCTYCNTLATTSTNYEVDLTKPNSTSTTVTDDVFWGIAVPFGVAAAPHQGSNIFYAIGD